jgi:hypothetical protein
MKRVAGANTVPATTSSLGMTQLHDATAQQQALKSKWPLPACMEQDLLVV